jgi:hypothetical protein
MALGLESGNFLVTSRGQLESEIELMDIPKNADWRIDHRPKTNPLVKSPEAHLGCKETQYMPFGCIAS